MARSEESTSFRLAWAAVDKGCNSPICSASTAKIAFESCVRLSTILKGLRPQRQPYCQQGQQTLQDGTRGRAALLAKLRNHGACLPSDIFSASRDLNSCTMGLLGYIARAASTKHCLVSMYTRGCIKTFHLQVRVEIVMEPVKDVKPHHWT